LPDTLDKDVQVKKDENMVCYYMQCHKFS